MAQMLTAKQVAEVKGCSPRYIKKIIQDGKLKAVETVNSKNRKTYLVPLDALRLMSLPRMNERKLISGSTSPSAGSHIERCQELLPWLK